MDMSGLEERNEMSFLLRDGKWGLSFCEERKKGNEEKR